MSTSSMGKKFEEVFKLDWKKSFPNTFIYRLPDQMSGFSQTSGNPCDFLCFPGDNTLYMLECKEHKGASIPFGAIPQYERLLQYRDINNIVAGCIIWFSEKDLVIFVPVQEMEKMVKDGKKSFNIKMLEEKVYNILVLPSVKKRVFLDTDYRPLLTLFKDE